MQHFRRDHFWPNLMKPYHIILIKVLLWANILSKNEVINARVYWKDDITENFVKGCLRKIQKFWINMQKNSAGKWHMNGWIKLPKKKRENTIYLWEENNSPCSRKKTTVYATYQRIQFWVRALRAADACYYLDCWLGVTIKDICCCLVDTVKYRTVHPVQS